MTDWNGGPLSEASLVQDFDEPPPNTTCHCGRRIDGVATHWWRNINGVCSSGWAHLECGPPGHDVPGLVVHGVAWFDRVLDETERAELARLAGREYQAAVVRMGGELDVLQRQSDPDPDPEA